MHYPSLRDRARESELSRYLQEAKTLLASANPPSAGPVDDLASADFEHPRWFDLPSDGLTTPNA